MWAVDDETKATLAMPAEEYAKQIDWIASGNGVSPKTIIQRYVLGISIWQNVPGALDANAMSHVDRRYAHYLKGSRRDDQTICYSGGFWVEGVLVEEVERVHYGFGEVVVRGRYAGKEVVWLSVPSVVRPARSLDNQDVERSVGVRGLVVRRGLKKPLTTVKSVGYLGWSRVPT